MNKHHRDEIDMKMEKGGRMREPKDMREPKKKCMSKGGVLKSEGYDSMVGEKVRNTAGYKDAGWGKVDAMVTGKHPTTFLATVSCAGNTPKKMAAGGVGKIRHEAYD